MITFSEVQFQVKMADPVCRGKCPEVGLRGRMEGTQGCGGLFQRDDSGVPQACLNVCLGGLQSCLVVVVVVVMMMVFVMMVVLVTLHDGNHKARTARQVVGLLSLGPLGAGRGRRLGQGVLGEGGLGGGEGVPGLGTETLAVAVLQGVLVVSRGGLVLTLWGQVVHVLPSVLCWGVVPVAFAGLAPSVASRWGSSRAL